MPRCAASSRRVASLASRSRIGSPTAPVSAAPSSSRMLARCRSKPSSRGHPAGEEGEAAGHQRRDRAVRAHRGDQLARAGREVGCAAQVFSSASSARPFSIPTRSRSAALKSSSPFMARRVIAAICSLRPAKSASSSSVSPVTMVLSMSAISRRLRRPSGLRDGVDRRAVERRAHRGRGRAGGAGDVGGLAGREDHRRRRPASRRGLAR